MLQQQEDILETLAILRQQEARYVAQDFLHQDNDQRTVASTASAPLHIDIDEDCRDKMTAWCFQVSKFCKFQNESIEIAMSCLDRFLTTEQGAAALQDRTTYQLACMVCLYTAVKVHERTAISPAIVSALARDAYSPAQVEEMERTILSALQWRVNPPTMSSFVRLGLDLAARHAPLGEKQLATAKDLCSLQLEMAVKEYRFVAVDRSVVAYCAMMNSLDAVGVEVARCDLGVTLAQAMQLRHCDDAVVGVSGALYASVVEHQVDVAAVMGESTPRPSSPARTPSKTGPGRRASLDDSPRSVAVTSKAAYA